MDSGTTKNGAVMVPSPCISWNCLPLASTSMATGEKNPGNAARCEQHIAEQLERLVVAPLGDRAHVPHHPTSGIEIGGRNKQTAAATVLGGDVRQELRRDALLDQALQRPVVEQAVARHAIFENVGGR